MADNVTVDNNALTDYSVATDKVTYSGDANQEIQLMRPVHVTGAEGSKTVLPTTVEISGQGAVVTAPIDGSGNSINVDGSTGALQTVGVSRTVGPSTLDADEESIEIDTAGMATVGFFLDSTDLSGFLKFEAWDGIAWSEGVGVFNVASWAGPFGGQGGVVAPVVYEGDVGAFSKWRVRLDSYTSGSVDVTAFAGLGARNTAFIKMLSDGSGNIATVNSDGALKVTLVDDSGVPFDLDNSSQGLYTQPLADGGLPGTGGTVAHDSPDSGNPVKIGGKAESTTPTPVADGDRTDAWFTTHGALATALVDGTGTQVAVGGVLNTVLVNQPAIPVTGNDGHDSPLTLTGPVVAGGRASAAAPTPVSTDGDAVLAWFLRNGAQATVVTAAGALIGGDATNGLDVDVTRSALPTGASTLAEQETHTGYLNSIDASTGVVSAAAANLGFDTYTETTTKGMTVGAVRRDADTTLVGTTNEIAPLQVDARGALKVEVFSGAEAIPTSFPGTAETDIATIKSNTDTIQLSVKTLGTGTYAEATTRGMTVGAVRRDADTTLVDTTNELAPLQVDANGALKVEIFDGGASHTVDAPVGTPVNVQIGNATLSAGVIDETGSGAVDALAVGGGTAHDAVDSGNPVKIGMKAANALPTAIANNDRANAISDLWGRQMTTHIDPAQQIHKSFNATSTQTGIDVWSPTSGKKIAVTSVIIGTYGTTAARVILWFGDNADTTYTAGTDQTLLAASFAPSSTSKPGLVFTPSVPVFCTTADRELHITTDAGISIDVTVEGYEW